jgi:transglutaminase-like putative cysteine protease
MTRRADIRPNATLPRVAAEATLVLVHVTVAAGFSRLYLGSSFLGPLLAFVLVAHALAFAGRRWSLPVPLVALLALAATGLVAAWTLFPATTAHGLPGPGAWHAATHAMSTARREFSDVLAPVPPKAGFQLWAGLALTVCVWFADWAAFRLRVSIEAIAPATVLFVFASILGSGAHQRASTVAFSAAVLAFLAAHRAMRAQAFQAWVTDAPTAGPRAMVRAGVAVAAVAVLAGAVVGPQLPGARAEPLVHWRRNSGNDRSRVTVSPMVELRRRLVDQSDTELFTVRANRPAYWRLTSLDRFDGQIWSSSGTFSKAGERLPSKNPSETPESRIVTQNVEIRALSTIWVPAAFEARGVTHSSENLRWDAASSTLIVDSSEDSSDGLDYTAVSEVPDATPGLLAHDPGRDSADINARYSSLPAGFPSLARSLAEDATKGAANRYQTARMLQDWFRTRFRYSLSVPAGHSDDALVGFLRSREGYCEQFAGAYAAMARSLGIPSRVAVGFTPGLADTHEAGEYHVLGRHAHAWPELWFPTVGWVAFEPTPGRGMPDAEDHTGVPPSQDNTPTRTTFPDIVTRGQQSTTTAPRGSSSATATSNDRAPRTAPVSSGTGTDGGSPLGDGLRTAVVVVLVLLAGWLTALLMVPPLRRRRRRHGLDAGGSAAHVLGAWHDTLAPVRWSTGLARSPAETSTEYAERAAGALGPQAGAFTELADLATAAAWSPDVLTTEQGDRADALAHEVTTGLRERDARSRRLRRRLSWREAFERPRPSLG